MDQFRYENGLTFISLPNVKTIDARAFRECSKLTQVDLPAATSIRDNAFAKTQVTTYNLPEVTYVGNNAFGGSSNAKVTRLFMPKLETFGDKNGHED